MPRTDLSGLPIAITGASSGIGMATALACAQAGMPVALMARRRDRLDAVAERVRASGVAAVVFEGDVADPASCAGFVTEAARALGPLHAVFANAGYGFEKPTWALDEAELRAIFEVNFWGSLHVVRAALPGMIERGRGHVLFCSSCLSKLGLPFYGAYSATKACQDHVARAMRHELRARGVFVSSVHPVGTSTEFFDAAAARSGGGLTLMDRASSVRMQPPDRVARAVVACLRSPRGEVWTSAAARLGFAAATALPGLADWAIARAFARRLRPGA